MLPISRFAESVCYNSYSPHEQLSRSSLLAAGGQQVIDAGTNPLGQKFQRPASRLNRQ
ncbi:hypothetical protein APY04_1721 [Hyphomicrobium sulfonivorans]|uniref:Uncharacterized protein n=1 Tax=Hyphomicrobium sulfonivorans TaxID=121290 RepID=A0A120CWC0_HYPSL|nr:hypothetical protein APY04_1721 [Hyphomicrobium sulfonivorans]